MPQVRVGGTDTYYQSEGEGAPVLFIHGGIAGPEPRFRVLTATGAPRLTTPEDALAALADRARIVSYHRRGHGLSGASPDDYTLADLAGDARALLDALGIERAAVIGHSLGGMVALQLALDHPERVARLGLAATGAGLLSEDDRFGRANLARFYANVSADVALSRRDGARAAFEARKDGLRQTTDRAPAGMAEWLGSLSEEELFEMYEALLRDGDAFLGVDLSSRLGELRLPVAVAHGDADRWVPIGHGQHLHQAIPQSTWDELPGAGHANLFDLPEGRAVLTRFVEDAAAGVRRAA